MKLVTLLSIAVQLLVLNFCPQVAKASVYVLAIGSNDSFDQKMKQLDYAKRDATEFAKTMQQVGAVPSSSVTLSVSSKLEEFESTLKTISEKMLKDPDVAVSKFVFFFSGHSDERGLHFGNGFFSKNSLDKYLAEIKVRTKVVILDSCFSGLMSTKGVREAKTFEMPRLNFDEPTGSIFLTATSSQDFAYESQKLKGGIFSRNVIEGLNGKADTNNDGIVTATELYEYAFRQTQLTSQLLPAPNVQTPEFVANLKGHGAIALAYPAAARGNIRFNSDLSGSIKLYAAKGIATFEHLKTGGQNDTIILPTGDYSVQVNDGKDTGNVKVNVASGLTQLVTRRDVTWNSATVDSSDFSRRGDISSSLEQHSPNVYRMSISSLIFGAGSYAEATLARVDRDQRFPVIAISRHWNLPNAVNDAVGVTAGIATSVPEVSDRLYALYRTKLHGHVAMGFKNISTNQESDVTRRSDTFEKGEQRQKMVGAVRAGMELAFFDEHLLAGYSIEHWFYGTKMPSASMYGVGGLGGATLGFAQKF